MMFPLCAVSLCCAVFGFGLCCAVLFRYVSFGFFCLFWFDWCLFCFRLAGGRSF